VAALLSTTFEHGDGPVMAFEWNIEELERLEPPPIPSVESLIATLSREGESVEAFHAMLLLARHGERASPALGALVARLKSSVARIRTVAARAIGTIGPAARDAVPALCAALDEAVAQERASEAYLQGSRELREALIDALGSIGPFARAALPHLAKAGCADYDFAVERIEPPERPALSVIIDPGLAVCAGRWRDAKDECVLPTQTRIIREPDGSRRIHVLAGVEGDGYASVDVFVRRDPDGRVSATAELARWSWCGNGNRGRLHHPVDGSITFGSVAFGKGRPVRGLLRIGTPEKGSEISFVCEDPFAPQ
jgi:hypothetical protein